MLDSKVYVYGLLKNNTALVSALGSNSKIQFQYPNDFNALPIITFTEENNRNINFFDNQSFADEISIKIDVWSNTSTSALSKLVDAVFAPDLWTRGYCADVPEPDAKIFHKVMKYSRVLSPDDLDAI